MGKVKIASYDDIDKVTDGLIMLANKYHLSLEDLEGVCKNAINMVRSVNPIVLTTPVEIEID